MRLILRQYLAALRERDELDAMLPDLLRSMGLNVFSKPGVGNRQYGVDVAAYGKLDENEKIYLFSIKAGNLGRSDWNSGSVQDLQPSLDEILTVYIPTHLPSEYREKPVEICICYGGDIDEKVRLNISQYETINSTDRVSFSEWGGEKISQLIEKYLLKEDLLPPEYRVNIRKSLAFVDEPEISYRHYLRLVKDLYEVSKADDRKKLSSLRQLHISLWILYSWCVDANNIESAYLAGERTFLFSWEICKDSFGSKNLKSKMLLDTLESIRSLYFLISRKYVDDLIRPYAGIRHALSNAVAPSSRVDTNLKLFEVLGRISMQGIWVHWLIRGAELVEGDRPELTEAYDELYSIMLSVKELVSNNPILLAPYKDSQGIDLFLALWLLSLYSNDEASIEVWLKEIVNASRFSFECNKNYPCNLEEYYELLEVPEDKSEEFKEDITAGSILYPIIGAFSALLNLNEVYRELQSFYQDCLQHCNMQVWYPDGDSESAYYINDKLHGSTLSHVALDRSEGYFLQQVFQECNQSSNFNELSAIKYDLWPLIFLASRHYRIPVPFHFLLGLRNDSDTVNVDREC